MINKLSKPACTPPIVEKHESGKISDSWFIKFFWKGQPLVE